MKFASWGRYPRAEDQTILPSPWRVDRIPQSEHTALPFGLGRSYGDSCLNNGGSLIPTLHLDHFIHFDINTGLLVVEAGVSLERILSMSVPKGWFLPVVPGTKFVTVGGAIANDIHGKNHHRSGTFGAHVTRFEVLRTTGERYVCSPTENPDLYRATIGGLGLTGLITWAEIQMKKISSSWIEMESLSFQNLDQFMAFSEESDQNFDFNVAWVDCFSRHPNMGRGLYMRGNFSENPRKDPYRVHPASAKLTVPVDAPSALLNSWTLGTFNALYYHKQFRSKVSKLVHYDPFFFPLDAIRDWNRLYGKPGFVQYQCVIPHEREMLQLKRIFSTIHASREGSFLAVLKTFGAHVSPGLMSFPRPGVTLALDFPMKGESTLALLDELDQLVLEAGGRVYPAKDARMSPRHFQKFFPQWEEFSQWIDPKMSSSFWRRVTCPIS